MPLPMTTGRGRVRRSENNARTGLAVVGLRDDNLRDHLVPHTGFGAGLACIQHE